MRNYETFLNLLFLIPCLDELRRLIEDHSQFSLDCLYFKDHPRNGRDGPVKSCNGTSHDKEK